MLASVSRAEPVSALEARGEGLMDNCLIPLCLGCQRFAVVTKATTDTRLGQHFPPLPILCGTQQTLDSGLAVYWFPACNLAQLDPFADLRVTLNNTS